MTDLAFFDPDEPQSFSLADPRRLPIYLDRWRSARVGALKGVFVICRENGREVWWAEPLAYVNSPRELFDTLLQRGKKVDELTAGGVMSAEVIDFTLAEVSDDTIREYCMRAFGSRQQCEDYLIIFQDARIHINSRDTNWGNITEVLGQYGLTLAGG